MILSQKDKYQQLLQRALSELVAFEIKYSTLSELTTIFDAIDNIKEKAI